MRLKDLFARKAAYRIRADQRSPSVLLADSCLKGVIDCLAPANQRHHEGVAFLLGRTDGMQALCMASVRPRAVTTPGSFHVPSSEMARVVALATSLDLQIVGQVHTHPRVAGHSDGDQDGANIRFDGFISIVIPDYGTHLPRLQGSAVYWFGRAGGWRQLPLSAITILKGGAAL